MQVQTCKADSVVDHSEQRGGGWSRASPGHIESCRARQLLVWEDKERLKVEEL